MIFTQHTHTYIASAYVGGYVHDYVHDYCGDSSGAALTDFKFTPTALSACSPLGCSWSLVGTSPSLTGHLAMTSLLVRRA